MSYEIEEISSKKVAIFDRVYANEDVARTIALGKAKKVGT